MKSVLAAIALLVAITHPLAHGTEPGKAPGRQYVYGAEVVRVIDGSTVIMNIDLGFHVWLHDETMRLDGVNAPDLKGEHKAEAQKWRDALQSLLEGRKLIIQTKKDKSPNPPTRFLVTIWADDENVNEALPKAVK
ncbi:MAG: micrococcal nuclease [Verrucomicrobiaceae bacterium]|nr:micrococcal nuclease [Verrucomicrobiaceae bacterium]